ncbi:MAG TPA: T9SS type A sorting domain-containing protein, partial [Chitinophagaceae bacterium]|nr:T9SS type A sorting domain-containing protein [Chitinophagaceae bacterium]
TTSEHNSKSFDLEKATDGVHFYLIGSVNAAGNSNAKRNYELIDKQISEVNYYRLKMVDMDGNFQYSQTIVIKNPGAHQNVWVLNNPFENSVRIRFAKTPGHVQCDLVNALGAKVYQKDFAGSQQLEVDCSKMYLATGAYFLRVNTDGQLFIRKLIKK